MALSQIAGVMQEHPLQLFGRQPAPKPPPRVRLGSVHECLTKALVQTGEALRIESGKALLGITHERRGWRQPMAPPTIADAVRHPGAE